MWSAPVNPGVGNSPGHIRVFSSDKLAPGRCTPPPLELAAALAGSIGKLWGELVATRHALAQREAELASGVPMVVRPRRRGTAPWARNLKPFCAAVPRRSAATRPRALFARLGDDRIEASFELGPAAPPPDRASTSAARRTGRSRSPVGPRRGSERRAAARLLEGSRAGLRCLRVRAIDQPIDAARNPVGLFERVAEFSDEQTNILEVVAGRITADLERQTLLSEALAARDQARHFAAVENAGHDLPGMAPMIEGWDIAARAVNSGPLAGTFYDWFAADDAGALALFAGEAADDGLAGSLTISAMRATTRSSAPGPRDPARCSSESTPCSGLRRADIEPRDCFMRFSSPMADRACMALFRRNARHRRAQRRL